MTQEGTKQEQLTVRVTYTKGKDKGASLELPVYPAEGDAWRQDVPP